MARIIKDQKVIESNILLNINHLYNEDSKRLQGTPIFVTYYNKNVQSSDEDRNLDNVKEVIGYESPNRFNRIEDFPLYLVEALSNNFEVDDVYGLNTDSEGEAVILPKMLKPYVDDHFNIIYNNDELLFEVTKVDFDRINGLKYYKISYKLSHHSKDDIEEQITEELVTRYENIGTLDKPIIQKSSSLLIDDIYECIDKLTRMYMHAYMNPKFNILTYKYNDKNIYNEFLIRFIIDNKVFESKFKKLYGTYVFQDIFRDSVGFMELYDNTIYMALSENDVGYFTMENMVTMEIQKDLKNNPFSFDYEEYYRVYPVDKGSHKQTLIEFDLAYEKYNQEFLENAVYNLDTDVFGKNTSNMQYIYKSNKDPDCKKRHILIIPHNNEFVDRIHSGICYEDEKTYYLENILIKYFNKTLIIDNEFVSKLKKKNWHPAFKEFILVPCLIFLLKKKIDQLTNNKKEGDT